MATPTVSRRCSKKTTPTGIALFCLTVFLVSLGTIYVGDEYVQPAFSKQSIPPPRSY